MTFHIDIMKLAKCYCFDVYLLYYFLLTRRHRGQILLLTIQFSTVIDVLVYPEEELSSLCTSDNEKSS